jgi:transposase
MPVSSPFVIVLSSAEEAVLSARARSGRTEHRDRVRAQLVLAAAAGTANAVIAKRLQVCVDTVRAWRKRFAEHRLEGLRDRPRSGRPPVFPDAARAEAVAVACALPAETGTPLSRWSAPEIARELTARCQVAASASTVRRWLTQDALKPWQHRSWIFPRDPDFAGKAARVLDPCADEKTSIQARCRAHPSLPPGKARMMPVEHEYHRGGALAYLAAWDVHRGHVTGRCEATTGIDPFSRLVTQVMSLEPYASADRVFSGHRQRVLPPRRRLRAAHAPGLAHRAPDPPAGARLLAGPGRDLLLGCSTQGRHPERLHRPRPDPRPPRCVRKPDTTPSPRPSTGHSPAPISTTCSIASTPTKHPTHSTTRHDSTPEELTDVTT